MTHDGVGILFIRKLNVCPRYVPNRAVLSSPTGSDNNRNGHDRFQDVISAFRHSVGETPFSFRNQV